MPNWVVTKVIAKDENKMNELMVNAEEECVDFNILIPCHEDLSITSGSYSISTPSIYFPETYEKNMKKEEKACEMLSHLYNDTISQADFLFKALKDKDIVTAIKKARGYKLKRGNNDGMSSTCIKEALVTFIKGYFNLQRHGEKDWYDWRRKYWGTKWNANDSVIFNGGLEFQTAWSTPYPILCELAKHTDIRVLYADEDRGSNCGMFDLHYNKETGEVECTDILGESVEIAEYVWDGDEPTVYDDDWNIIDDDEDERYIEYMNKYKPFYDMVNRLFTVENIGVAPSEESVGV